MPLQRVQAETTACEFTQWMYFLGQQKVKNVKELDKSDLHAAKIACEVRRSWVKHPDKVLLKDFLPDPDETEKKPVKKLTIKERAKAAKDKWFAVLGKPEGAE